MSIKLGQNEPIGCRRSGKIQVDILNVFFKKKEKPRQNSNRFVRALNSISEVFSDQSNDVIIIGTIMRNELIPSYKSIDHHPAAFVIHFKSLIFTLSFASVQSSSKSVSTTFTIPETSSGCRVKSSKPCAHSYRKTFASSLSMNPSFV